MQSSVLPLTGQNANYAARIADATAGLVMVWKFFSGYYHNGYLTCRDPESKGRKAVQYGMQNFILHSRFCFTSYPINTTLDNLSANNSFRNK